MVNLNFSTQGVGSCWTTVDRQGIEKSCSLWQSAPPISGWTGTVLTSSENYPHFAVDKCTSLRPNLSPLVALKEWHRPVFSLTHFLQFSSIPYECFPFQTKRFLLVLNPIAWCVTIEWPTQQLQIIVTNFTVQYSKFYIARILHRRTTSPGKTGVSRIWLTQRSERWTHIHCSTTLKYFQYIPFILADVEKHRSGFRRPLKIVFLIRV